MRRPLSLAVTLSLLTLATAQAQSIIQTVVGGGPAPVSSATNVGLGSPAGIAADGNGNVYLSNMGQNQIWRAHLPTSTLTVVAGTGAASFAGDGGPAIAAAFWGPSGLALDGLGNLYVADTFNQRIRKIDTNTGTVTTIAGNGGSGYGGDGAPALAALLRSPRGVTVDSAGHVYIGDTLNHRVRKIIAGTGIIVTVAGNGSPGFSGDGAAATSAQLRSPLGVAIDGSGRLYIADSVNHRIRRVATNAIISTVAGNGLSGFAGDGGAATAARINFPADVAIDSAQNIYIADQSNHRIRKVTSSGTIFTAAGNGIVAFAGDGAPATNASLNFPQNVALDPADTLFIIDFSNRRIRSVSQSGLISTIAGNGTSAHGGNGAAATSAQLSFPHRVAFDSGGNLYVDDGNNAVVRRVDAVTGIITTAAGVVGNTSYNGDGIPATTAHISSIALTFDASDNLYLAEATRVRKVSAATGIITTVAGVGLGGYSGDGGLATNARFTNARAVAFDSFGDLYLADYENHVVRKVNMTTGIITTVAGNGLNGFAGDGGPATAARLHRPSGLGFDAQDNLHIADAVNNRIRKVARASGIITTIAGSGGLGFADGPALSARLNSPADVTFDAAGIMYIADEGNHRVRAVSSGVMSTVAGTGVRGFAGDDGLATLAMLATPQGVTVDASERLHIVDTNNHRVRRLASANAVPIAVAGADQTIEATAPSTSVSLDATASTDPDDEPLSFEWRDAANDVISTDSVASLSLPVGTHAFRVRVVDPHGASDEDEVSVIVQDTTGPTIHLVAPAFGPYPLLEPITADYSCSDAVSGIGSCEGTVAAGEPIDTATAGAKGFAVHASDGADNPSSLAITYSVSPGTPTVVWPTPAPITIGTALGGAQLNASAVYRSSAVSATFAYSPAAGTVLGLGSHTLMATLAPSDASNYVPATGSTTILVSYGVCTLFDQSRAHRAGSTVPVKIQLCNSSGANLSAAALAVTARALVRVSNAASQDVEDSGHANRSGDFRYDATLDGSGGYIFNLDTSGLVTGTYRLDFGASGDAVTHSVLFQVR